MLNLADSAVQLASWCLRLSEFDFVVIHRDGMKHEAADALSRLSRTGKDESPSEGKLPLLGINHVVNTNFLEAPTHVNDHRVAIINSSKAKQIKATYQPSNLVKLIRSQKNNVTCRTSSAQVGCTHNELYINSDVMSVR